MGKRNYKLPAVRIRLERDESISLVDEDEIDTPEKAVRLVGEEIKSRDREYLYMINLDCRLKPISVSLISVGNDVSAKCDMKMIFKTALLANASKIILVHNHPSGDLMPSSEDLVAYRKAIEAGSFLDILVYDSIITNGISHFSMGSLPSDIFKKLDEMDKINKIRDTLYEK